MCAKFPHRVNAMGVRSHKFCSPLEEREIWRGRGYLLALRALMQEVGHVYESPIELTMRGRSL